MVRDAFNTQILNLRREVIALGGLCDEALDKVQQTMDSRAEHGEHAVEPRRSLVAADRDLQPLAAVR